MSNCVDCKDCLTVNPIPVCTSEITICDDLGLTTLYSNTYVYIQNLATGRITRHLGTITGGKVVIIPGVAFHNEVKYLLWINNTQDDVFHQELMTVDGFEAYCIEFETFSIVDNTGTSITDFHVTFNIKTR